jgi:hypothetical protein
VLGPEERAAHGGADPVERHDQVVGLPPAVGEDHVDGVPAVGEVLDRRAVGDLDAELLGAGDERVVQVDAGQRVVNPYGTVVRCSPSAA